jgi:hypothetical protein
MELIQQETNALGIPEKPQNGFSALAMERHYTVGELSKLWFFSENTIRRMFIHEPGVIKITRQATRVKRGYTSLRIPERIAEKVHRRLQSLP